MAMKVWKKWSCAGVMLSAGLLAGCGGDSSFSSADLRVVHAAGNAPAVNVNVNGSALAAAQGLNYSEASSLVRVRDATYSVSVDGILSDGSVSEVLEPTSILLNKGLITTVVAMGNVGGVDAQAFAPLVIATPRAKIAADSTRVQVVHASVKADDAAAEVSVYMTSPEADLNDETPVTTFGLRGVTDALTVPTGDYRIRITPAASGVVVFDSGTVTLPGGVDLLILAVDSFSPGSPVKLLVSTGDADSDFVIADAGMPAELRVVHAASGVGPADVFASSAEQELNDEKIVDSLGFREQIDVPDLSPATDYIVAVNAAERWCGRCADRSDRHRAEVWQLLHRCCGRRPAGCW
jgi:trimeric autotransporter adhesin